MSKVIGGFTLSLDGFASDRNGSLEQLYPDLEQLAESEVLQASMRSTGAVVMGRRAYEMANGDFTGYEYQTPIFVVTHQPPQTRAKGENDKLSFHFVTDGIEQAVEQAKTAAGERDVMIVGGASVLQQCLLAGLVDELNIAMMPVFLGDGLRPFDQLDGVQIALEKINVMESAGGRVDVFYRVLKQGA